MKPDFWQIARLEAGFFRRSARLLLAAGVVVLIPALYVLIYLASVWDPAAHTGALPVAIVNLDRGLEYRQQAFNVGRDVTDRLKSTHGFGYVDLANEPDARWQVRQGLLAFALIIPADFSSNAVPGAQAGAGKLVIYTSEGNSYSSAGLARRFAEDLGREVNQSLNEQRWALVLSDADGSQRSIERLRDGVTQLRLGARELNSGAQQAVKVAELVSGGASRVDQSVLQLSTGVRELSAGIKSMYAQRPRNSALNRLEEGARSLNTGHAEMATALGQLHQGAMSLQSGVSRFSDEVGDSLFVTSSLRQGVGQLSDGLGSLESGLKAVGTSHAKLHEGSSQLYTAVGTLSTGLRSLNSGLRSMVTQLPDDARLDELRRGTDSLSTGSTGLKLATHKLHQGAQHLAGGLDLLEASLPAPLKKIDGNAQGLASSVQPRIEVAAPVQNNGSAFAPNIIPGALWLGASLAAFLIHLRRLPHQAQGYSAVSRMLGKLVLPMAVVQLQALMLGFIVLFILQLSVQDKYALVLTLMTSSATFLLIVVALTRALGDAGKALALMLLAVQLSSSGGVLPVELSGGLFAWISPYLPITWVVVALKACLFGAFQAGWQEPLQRVAMAGMLAALLACFVGRWRFVKVASLRPSLDV